MDVVTGEIEVALLGFRESDRFDWIGLGNRAIPRVVGDDEFFTERTAYLRGVERSPLLIRDGDGLG